jgi:hypothetical protein
MSRWFWWLGPPLLAIALLLHFASRSAAIEIAGDDCVPAVSYRG